MFRSSRPMGGCLQAFSTPRLARSGGFAQRLAQPGLALRAAEGGDDLALRVEDEGGRQPDQPVLFARRAGGIGEAREGPAVLVDEGAGGAAGVVPVDRDDRRLPSQVI